MPICRNLNELLPQSSKKEQIKEQIKELCVILNMIPFYCISCSSFTYDVEHAYIANKERSRDHFRVVVKTL